MIAFADYDEIMICCVYLTQRNRDYRVSQRKRRGTVIIEEIISIDFYLLTN
jgi:hypothetical protein